MLKNNIWHTKENIDLLSLFSVNKSTGLLEDEALKRLKKNGLNTLENKKKVTIFSIFLEQFKSPLIYVLLVALIIVFILGEVVDSFIILAVILINSIIGTVQEGKARNTLEALQTVITSKATVLRGGKIKIIDDKELVPGDIILLKDGDVVSADARIIESNQLRVNESALTGESAPVEKTLDSFNKEEMQIAEQTNMVFRGTYIVSGIAKALVVQTGKNTAIGGIAKKLDTIDGNIPLKKNIAKLSQVLIWIIILFSSAIFIAGVLNQNSISEMFLIVVVLAVSAIPESLPVVVTVVLAAGVWRMSKRNALVKRLQAVETLGQATVLALDKTGTITKNQMMVEKIMCLGESFRVSGDGYNPDGAVYDSEEKVVTPGINETLKLIGKVASFTARARVVFNNENNEWEANMGDPTEASLITLAQKINMPREVMLSKFPLVAEIPFNFEDKHHTAVNKVEDDFLLTTAGSPEVLLKNSTHVWVNGKKEKINDSYRKEIKKIINEASMEGYRLLGMAFEEGVDPDEIKKTGDLPNKLVFLGVVAITDVIRSDVDEAILAAREVGMKVVMITGDHAFTAKSIAKKIGLYNEDKEVMTGDELEKLSDEELDRIIKNINVFARVSPEHKLRIIESFKRNKEIIAMTGDGINDALSLVAADLGVSMGKIGTEVAREASDIILVDDNFDNIRVAVEEGRSIYHTIRTSVLYLLSTNIGELLVVTVAVFLGWPVPLLATQIVWLNMVTDTFLVAALALEPKDHSLLKKRMKKTSEYLVDSLMLSRILLIGIAMTVVTLSLFYLFKNDADLTKAWTITLTTLTICQWYNIWNIRSKDKSIFKTNPFSNKWLVLGSIIALGLHALAIYNPFLQNLLHTTALSVKELVVIFIVATAVLVVEELRKLITNLFDKHKSRVKLKSV